MPRAASICRASTEAIEPTGVALILVGADGENVIAVVPGANGTVTAEAVARRRPLREKNMSCLQHEVPLDTVEAALDAARAAGAVIAAQHRAFPPRGQPAACQGRLCDRQRNRIRPLCRRHWHLAAPIGWRTCARFAEKTGRTIVVTLGGDGVIAATPDAMLKVGR